MPIRPTEHVPVGASALKRILGICSLIAIAVLAVAVLTIPDVVSAESVLPDWRQRPTGLTVSAGAEAGALAISWDASAQDSKTLSDYRVTWAPDGEPFKPGSETDWNAFPTSNELTVTGLSAGATYQVKFRARYSDSKKSKWSHVVTGQAASAVEPAPAAPAPTEPAPTEPAVTEPAVTETQAGTEKGDGSGDGAAPRSHSGQHVAASDIVLDFGTTNLTGTASDYKVGGLHMDATHVYVLLVGTNEGLFKFNRSTGAREARTNGPSDPRGLAGTSSFIYLGGSNCTAHAYTQSTLANSDSNDIHMGGCVPGNNFKELYALGDVLTKGPGTFLTYTGRHFQVLTDGNRDAPRFGIVRISGSGSLNENLSGIQLLALGYTLSNVADIDTATDGSTLMFLENRSGNGALTFTWKSNGRLDRSPFQDVNFGSGSYDGLHYDGDKLWTLDLDSLDVADDQFTLRAYEPGTGPTIPAVAEVTNSSFDGAFLRSEKTRSGSQLPFPNHAVDLDGDGRVDYTMFATEGVTLQGMWGDSDHLYVADQHTTGVYAISLDDLINDATHGGSLAFGRSFGPGLLARDRRNHRHNQFNRYVSVTAVWANDDYTWISDDNNAWLRAHVRGSGERERSTDILLYTDRHGLMAVGLWSDGDTMWVNAIPYHWYEERTTLSAGIYKVDLSDGSITKANGFTGLTDDEGNQARDIWSDGETLWIATHEGKIKAYELDTGSRRTRYDITTRRGRGDGKFDDPLTPGGLWSDGEYMFYGDQLSGKIYIYRLAN